MTVAGTDAPPLLALKLSVPSPAPRLVPRPRLLDRLDAGLDSRLTLICAPAGFGKTTLLAGWLRHQPVGIRRAVAWLSLDAADAEPSCLLRYLVAALQTVAPEAGASTLALLRSPQSLSIPALLTGLLNDLAALTGQTLLVLDDYHLLQGASVHEAVAFLVEHLPPALHLVIATREDPPLPLARLRARQQLAELRADDLRFTPAEAATFLQEVMGLPLSPGEVLALEERTEGWIAGLQLAALAMRDRADVAGFVAAFTGSNRYILDYLGEEVFGRQPPHLQAFLLQTSILEHMCGALCDAVVLGSVPAAGGSRQCDTDGLSSTPRVSPGAYSQVLLDELERTNLFVVPLDDARGWYRYHHLFRDVLRARLLSGAGAATVATLHRRAAAWYAQAGLVVEAVRHALAASDWVGAAELIEETAQTMIGRGEATTVGRWLDALPAEVVRTRARLSITAAWVLSFTPATDAMEVRLQDAERILIAGEPAADNVAGRDTLLAEVTALQGYVALRRHELLRASALFQQALAHIPEHNVRLQGFIVHHLGHAYRLRGDVAAAAAAFANASTIFTRAPDQRLLALYPLVALAALQGGQGHLTSAIRTYREALHLASDGAGRLPPLAGLAHIGLGNLLRERNALAEAAGHLRAAIALGRRGGLDDVVADGSIALARVLQAQGASDGAHALLQQAEDIARPANDSARMRLIAASRSRVLLAQGQIGEAAAWAPASHPALDDVSDMEMMERLTCARLLIAQQQPDQASALLERLLQAAETAGRMDRLIEVLTLQALARHAQHDLAEALNILERALAFAIPAGYVRLFVDEGPRMAALLREAQARGLAPDDVAALLPHFGLPVLDIGFSEAPPIHDPQPTIQNLDEPLSTRELEVLRLIAAGKSNAEIARTLVIAVSTVKSHTNRIFGKLGVTSRTQALVRARDLHLL